jgi:hypothetical protein
MNILKILLLLILTVLSSSCSIPESKYPTINFIGGKNMVDQDIALKSDTTFQMGINANSNSECDIYKFRLFRISNNISEIIIDSTLNNKVYNAVFNLPTSEYDNVERWVFSITCEDGYTSEISAQITTSDTLKNIKQSTSKVNAYIMTDLPSDRNLKETQIVFLILIGLVILIILLQKRKNKIGMTEYNPYKYKRVKRFFKKLLLFIVVVIIFLSLLILNFIMI